jgi:hypothetical protein
MEALVGLVEVWVVAGGQGEKVPAAGVEGMERGVVAGVVKEAGRGWAAYV